MKYVGEVMKCSLALVAITATVMIWAPFVVAGMITVLVEKHCE